jgi:hypothetical protein
MTHLLALIFLALCAIVILLATPQEDRGTALKVIVGTVVALVVLSWLWPFVVLAGYRAVHSHWFAYIFGSPVDTEALVLTGGTLVIGGGLSLLQFLSMRQQRRPDRADAGIDPVTADGGIMFRGKRLSREEYTALPAREKARWQDEANRPSL